LGRRISKTTAGVTTRFYRDGDALLGELRFERKDGTDAYEEPVCTRWREWIYYPGSFEPLAMVEQASLDKDKAQPERIYYYANDPNGCPTRLLDETGKVVWAALYDAWGKVKKLPANEVDQPLRLQGQYFDAETGLHYNRFRYYCPKIGSFISQDPLGLVPGENVYEFGPNAQGWIDPLGLACYRVVNGTKIYGRGQKTGPGHAQLSEILANKLAMTGKFKEVHLNRSYEAVTGTRTTPRRSPDLIAVDHNGRIHSIEIASRSDMSPQKYQNLVSRNQISQQQLPTVNRGRIVVVDHPYSASSTKTTIDNWLSTI